jgi:NAD-dependent dihydropyrimidine dehydrogenase PreA subunit
LNGSELILACDCVHRNVIPAAVKQQVLDSLKAAGKQVTIVADLCGMAASNDPILRDLVSARNPIVLACHPRAVKWLLHAAGMDPLPVSLSILNLRTQSAGTILAQLGLTLAPVNPDPLPSSPPRPSITNNQEPITPPPPAPWIPWFPVIDYDRCVQCRQCVSFCPFGVYTVKEERVLVTTPQNCKDNCPACARMCPKQAIIFPKVGEVPIDGSEVGADVIQAARHRNLARDQALAGGDIHAVLAKRKLKLKAQSQ